MPVNLRVHEHRKVPGASDETRVIMVNPYIRVSNGDTAYFIQRGQVWTAEGPALSVEGLPDWFWSEVNKINPASLKMVQFEVPSEKEGVQILDDKENRPVPERQARRARR